MDRNLITDLQSLTQVNNKVLDKLVSLSELSICDSMYELDMLDEQILNLDIGFGTISFLLADNSISYAFTPSESLETELITTLEEKVNPLTSVAENKLQQKLYTTYKELI